MSNTNIGPRDYLYQRAAAARQNASEVEKEAENKRDVTSNDVDAMYSIYLRYTELGHGDNSPVLIAQIQDYIDSNNLNTTVDSIKATLISRYKSESKPDPATDYVDNSALSDYLDYMKNFESEQSESAQTNAESEREKLYEQIETEKANLTGLEKQRTNILSTKTQTEAALSSINANLLEKPDKNDYIYGFNEVAESEYNRDLAAYENQQNAIKQLEKKLEQLKSDLESTEKNIEKTNTKINDLEAQLADIEAKENEEFINEYLSENYPEFSGDIDLIKTLVGVDVEGVDAKVKIETAIELAKAAEGKDVDGIDYIAARYADFAQMKAENPDITFEEMNEKLALFDVNDLMFNNVNSIISDIFGVEPQSYDELLELQQYELALADEYPELRQAFIQTNNMIYLGLASEGNLTREDYYELIKNDLVNIYPNSDEIDEAAYSELLNNINKLSPEEIQDFIQKVLSLPASSDENYDEASKTLANELNSIAQGKQDYVTENPDEVMSLAEVYSAISGVEFNPDNIINKQLELEKIEDVINASVIYQAAQNLFDAVDNNDLDIGSALWQMAYLYTNSVNETELLDFIKDITGNNDIYIEKGRVIVPEPQTARTRGGNGDVENSNEQSTWESVKDWCGDVFQGVVDLCISESVQEQYAASDLTSVEGVLNFAGDLISNPEFYKDMGKLVLTGAGIAATGGVGAGVLITASVGTAAYAAGAQGALINSYYKDGGLTTENVTNYVADLMEGAGYLAGIKYANAAIELPAFAKAAMNKVTGTLSKLFNKASGIIGTAMQKTSAGMSNAAHATTDGISALVDKMKNYCLSMGDYGKNNLLTTLDSDEIFHVSQLLHIANEGKIPNIYNTGKGWRTGTYTPVNANARAYIKDAVDKFNKSPKKTVETLKNINRYDIETEARAECVKIAENLASKNKTPVDLVLSVKGVEYNQKLMESIIIDNKSLSQWLKECAESGNYNSLIEAVNSAKPSKFVLDDALVTNIVTTMPNGKVNLLISAPEGSNGLFTGMFGNEYMSLEHMLPENTKFKGIEQIIFDTSRNITLITEIEVKQLDGTTIIKKAAIYLGALIGASIPANAHSENTQQERPTGGVSGGGHSQAPQGQYNPINPLITPNYNGDNSTTPSNPTTPENPSNPAAQSGDQISEQDGENNQGNQEAGMEYGPGHPDYDFIYGDENLNIDIAIDDFNTNSAEKQKDGDMIESGVVDYSNILHNNYTDGKSISNDDLKDKLISDAIKLLKQKFGEDAKINCYFDTKGQLHWTVEYNSNGADRTTLNNNGKKNPSPSHHGGGGGHAHDDMFGDDTHSGISWDNGGAHWNNDWGSMNGGLSFTDNSGGGGGGSVASVEIGMDWYYNGEFLDNDMN